jgi:tRNA threonylcarbamoyladenosine biosynthesis protein TsaE
LKFKYAKEKMDEVAVEVHTLDETRNLAKKIAENLKGGEIICLIGNLGAGKTYFTKYLAEALGVNKDTILSPTFVYWRQHQGDRLNLNHFDFYRIDHEDEVEDLGFEESLGLEGEVTVIEWADKIPDYLPSERLEITIELKNNEERLFTIKSLGKKFDYLIKEIS